MILFPCVFVLLVKCAFDRAGRFLFMEFLRKQKHSETHLFFHTLRLWKQKISLFFVLAAYLPISSVLLVSYRDEGELWLRVIFATLCALWMVYFPLHLCYYTRTRVLELRDLRRQKEEKKLKNSHLKLQTERGEDVNKQATRQGVSFIEVERLFVEKKALKKKLEKVRIGARSKATKTATGARSEATKRLRIFRFLSEERRGAKPRCCMSSSSYGFRLVALSALRFARR